MARRKANTSHSIVMDQQRRKHGYIVHFATREEQARKKPNGIAARDFSASLCHPTCTSFDRVLLLFEGTFCSCVAIQALPKSFEETIQLSPVLAYTEARKSSGSSEATSRKVKSTKFMKVPYVRHGMPTKASHPCSERWGRSIHQFTAMPYPALTRLLQQDGILPSLTWAAMSSLGTGNHSKVM